MTKKHALEGIKVVDFGWAIAVPLAAEYLANHGATVIHVETHKRLDTLRTANPYKDEIQSIDRTAFFTQYNSNKFGMSLDMNHPRSGRVKFRLIKWADIIITSYSLQALKKLGIDYEKASQINPSIVYYESSAQLHWGPHGDYVAYGTELSCLGGWGEVCGWPDRTPLQPYGAYNDFVSPRIGVSTIMAALDNRRRTGKGVHLEQSQLECGLQFYATALLDYVVNGRVATRNGNRCPEAAPHGAYPCKGEDAWCVITVFSDKEWQAFTKSIGEPKWTRDKKYETLADRKQNEDELDELVSEWTKTHSPQEVMDLMQSEGVAAGVVNSPRDLFRDPQLKHRNNFKRLKHQVIGVHAYNSLGFILSKTPARMVAAPCLGQHNQYVYKDILGFSDDEIAEFLTEGVITTEADLPESKRIT